MNGFSIFACSLKGQAKLNIIESILLIFLSECVVDDARNLIFTLQWTCHRSRKRVEQKFDYGFYMKLDGTFWPLEICFELGTAYFLNVVCLHVVLVDGYAHSVSYSMFRN